MVCRRCTDRESVWVAHVLYLMGSRAAKLVCQVVPLTALCTVALDTITSCR
jgi:hypothetical protein